MADYDKIDDEILLQIERLRHLFNACTARAVSREMRVSADVIRYRLQGLKNVGKVDWNDMPGSLVVVAGAGGVSGHPPALTDKEPTEASAPADTEGKSVSKKAAPRKKAAATKS